MERKSIHDRCHHAYVVSSCSVHATGAGAGPTPEVAATTDDSNFNAAGGAFADFFGNALDNFWRDIVLAARLSQGFATEF